MAGEHSAKDVMAAIKSGDVSEVEKFSQEMTNYFI